MMRLDNRAVQELRLTEALRRVRAGAGGSSALELAGALARLSGLDDADALRGLLADARTAASPAVMATAGRVVDLDQLIEDGRAAADELSRRRWLDRAVDVAAVRGWLEARRAAQVDVALSMCAAIVLAEPRAWAATLRAVSAGVRLPEPWDEVLHDAALSLLADRAAGAPRGARVAAVLDQVRSTSPDLLDAAEDALADLRALAVLQPPRADASVFAAADGRALVLATMLAGRWVYVEEGGRALLRFEGDVPDGVVRADVVEGDQAGPLPTSEPDVFPLPALRDVLVLRLRVGSDSRTVRLGRG